MLEVKAKVGYSESRLSLESLEAVLLERIEKVR